MDPYAYLPHKNKEYWNKKKEFFNTPANNISDLNKIFFNGKAIFFDEIEKNYKEQGEEFMKYYKNLQNLALDLEKILPEKISILQKDTTDSFELTRKEAALIFLLSFLNIIDITQEEECEKNYFRVYQLLYSISDRQFEFSRCFLNYLTVIGKWLSENNPILEEKITYIRDSKIFNEEIFKEEIELCEIKLYNKGSLFDGDSTYCVDFANKFIGGGVLEGGCVQEEILFAVEPEAVVAMFFMEVMTENDAIRIDNTIQYTNYTGYCDTFKYKECAINDDLKNIKKTKFIAIDASIAFMSENSDDTIQRDIHKAYVGFNLIYIGNEEKRDAKRKKKEINEKKEKKTENENKDNNDEISLATGNWGCGAFNGDPELKFFQQWIAASVAGVDRLDYYTYGSKTMGNVIQKLEEIKKNVNMQMIYIIF
jgi:poly(ADP-ribose) glycohydrolase